MTVGSESLGVMPLEDLRRICWPPPAGAEEEEPDESNDALFLGRKRAGTEGMVMIWPPPRAPDIKVATKSW
jgi:hypothetical protein